MPAEPSQPTADEFLPPKPLDPSAGLQPDVPAAPEFVAESAAPPTTEVFELPPEPAPADALAEPPMKVPGLSSYLLDEPSLPTAPRTTPVPQFSPQDLRGGRLSDSTSELTTPAPFIPPAPEDFGGQLETPVQEYYVPGALTEPGPGLPVAKSPASDLAPDVTAWAPEPLPADPNSLPVPDPIVAPSTAKRLEAPSAPTPQQTNSKLERIASRKGLNGFKGFCPVAIKDHRELIDARPEYSAVFNGRRYFFSSAASQALFEANPENYAPAALGNDVVHLMLTGESRSGSLEHAVWFRSRLYMFATAETMETFVASPSIHAWEE
jgi:YHS domain-containing protein